MPFKETDAPVRPGRTAKPFDPTLVKAVDVALSKGKWLGDTFDTDAQAKDVERELRRMNKHRDDVNIRVHVTGSEVKFAVSAREPKSK